MDFANLKEYCDDHKGKNKVIAVVCYPMEYATEVHERTDIPHKVGQAKFLESAARELVPEVRKLIREGADRLPETLVKCGLLIQREAQIRTPVDTSALKSSAFTSFEEELDARAAQKRTQAEALRTSVLASREKEARKK